MHCLLPHFILLCFPLSGEVNQQVLKACCWELVRNNSYLFVHGDIYTRPCTFSWVQRRMGDSVSVLVKCTCGRQTDTLTCIQAVFKAMEKRVLQIVESGDWCLISNNMEMALGFWNNPLTLQICSMFKVIFIFVISKKLSASGDASCPLLLPSIQELYLAWICTCLMHSNTISVSTSLCNQPLHGENCFYNVIHYFWLFHEDPWT